MAHASGHGIQPRLLAILLCRQPNLISVMLVVPCSAREVTKQTWRQARGLKNATC